MVVIARAHFLFRSPVTSRLDSLRTTVVEVVPYLFRPNSIRYGVTDEAGVQ